MILRSATLFWAVLGSAAFAQADRSASTLHYTATGTMSSYRDLSIDLTDGSFTDKKRSAFERDAPAITITGKLGPDALARLRTKASAAIKAGFEARSCRQAREKARRHHWLMMDMPHTPDYLPSLSVLLDGRNASAPRDPGCWSDAAEDLLGLADTLIRAPEK